MSCIIVIGCGVPLGCHWIAGEPFLDGRARPRHFRVVADIALLVDVGLDLLHCAAISAIDNLFLLLNGNPPLFSALFPYTTLFRSLPTIKPGVGVRWDPISMLN